MKNGETIKVPDFRTIQDFREWVKGLDEKEIQSWRAKDWNKMYEKLSQSIDNSIEIEERIPAFLRSGKYFTQTDLRPEDLSEEKLALAKKKLFMRGVENIFVMAKLYMNYRMEPEQLKKIYELAQKAGKIASEHRSYGNVFGWDEDIKTKMKSIDSIVLEQSSYPKVFKQRGILEYPLHSYINLMEKDGSTVGYTSNSKGTPQINIARIDKYGDMRWGTMFHEAAHAHLQSKKSEFGEEIAKVKPVETFDDDFAQLLNNNNDFYFDSDMYIKVVKKYKIGTILYCMGKTSGKLAKKMLSTIAPYRRQPVEYFAHFYGYIAERSFRRVSGQYTERHLEETIKHMERIGLYGHKLFSDKEGNTILHYSRLDDKKKGFLKYLFTGAGNPLNGKIKVEETSYSTDIKISSGGFFMQKAWQEWEEKIWQPLIEKQSEIQKYLEQIGLGSSSEELKPDENGNINININRICFCTDIESIGFREEDYYEYLFTGRDNPMDGKIKINGENLSIPTDDSMHKTWQDWEKGILEPMQNKLEDFAKAFTSKNKFHIEIGNNGAVCIEFDKGLPYSGNEIRKKVYGVDDECDDLQSKIKSLYVRLKNKGLISYHDKDRSLRVPPVYSKEFNFLLNLFKQDKIGWIEAEQKRDAIKRYRRMKIKKIANKLGYRGRSS